MQGLQIRTALAFDALSKFRERTYFQQSLRIYHNNLFYTFTLPWLDKRHDLIYLPII